MLFVSLCFLTVIVYCDKLDQSPTPESNLRIKCRYYNVDAVFAKNKCYVLDQQLVDSKNNVSCHHLHGFDGKIATYDIDVIKHMELRNIVSSNDKILLSDRDYGSSSGKARTLCEYKDVLYCDTGYFLNGIHCYKLHKNNVKWAEARDACQREGSMLAVPHNDNDGQFLASMVARENIINDNDNTFIWVGMYIEDHKKLKVVDSSCPNYFRWLPIGHKRFLTDAYQTPNTVVAIGTSASNTGNVGQFGYYQVINGNFHKLPFLCQKPAKSEYDAIYYPKKV